MSFDDLSNDLKEFVKEEQENLSKSNMDDEYKTYVDNNEEELEKSFNIAHSFETSVRGLKIRGSYPTVEEAEMRAKLLRETDPNHDVFVGPVNLICDFWKDIGSKENIHKYAMTKMKNQRFSNVFDYTYDLDYESNIFHKKIIETGEDKVSMFATIVFVVFSAIYLFRFSVVFIWKYI
jgi:hypothetical protein